MHIYIYFFQNLEMIFLFLISTVLAFSNLTDILGHINPDRPESEMSMLEIVRHHGYPIEHEFVETEDGHLLDVYRIKGPKGAEDKQRKPILLVHGILQSSFRFVINGPEKSIAYILADTDDYDVYMINLRGNTFSKNHKFLDSSSSPQFWDFTFEEFGEKDIPAVIKHISRGEKVPIIAYSQGATAALFGMSK